jgi:phage-related protein
MKKALIIHNKVAKDLCNLEQNTRIEVAEVLSKLQYGIILGLPISRPMPVVYPGVHEIRIGDRIGNYRIFYYLKSSKGILVFHLFQKKTQKTPLQEIRLGKTRLKELLRND